MEKEKGQIRNKLCAPWGNKSNQGRWQAQSTLDTYNKREETSSYINHIYAIANMKENITHKSPTKNVSSRRFGLLKMLGKTTFQLHSWKQYVVVVFNFLSSYLLPYYCMLI